jgi:hypothetical protein
MTQESTAFGTCYLRAKTKENIMDFFDLQAASQRYIWEETTLELPDDYENAFIKTKNGLYELKLVIYGHGVDDFTENMKKFFISAFSKNYGNPYLIEIRDDLYNKYLEAEFDIVDYEESANFITDGRYINKFENRISTFDTLEKIEMNFDAINCRKYDIHPDAYDSNYALDNFDEFIERIKEQYEVFESDEVLRNIVEHPEHTRKQLEKYAMPVYDDIDTFINEFIEIYEEI